jgi:hypothetical protein
LPLEQKDSSEDFQPKRLRKKRRLDLESQEDADMKVSDNELEV